MKNPTLKRLELYLTNYELIVLNKLAKEDRRSRKNYCEVILKKVIKDSLAVEAVRQKDKK